MEWWWDGWKTEGEKTPVRGQRVAREPIEFAFRSGVTGVISGTGITMKKWLFPVAAGLLMQCGCAHEYVMKLSNGMQITTPHKPKLKGSDYYYKDAMGRENIIPQSRVLEIEPTSMAAEENKFTPSKPETKHWWQF